MERAHKRGGSSPGAERNDRGRSASRPGEIPPRGWRDIALRVWRGLGEDNVSIVAAGVAFYGLLALFPAIGALVSIYGLAADPATLERQLDLLRSILPEDALGIIRRQLQAVVNQPASGLSWGVVFGFALTLWSATSGVKTLMTALNIVYDEQEKRGFLWFNVLAIALTAGALVAATVAIILIIVLPAVLAFLNQIGWIAAPLRFVLSFVHLPILGALCIFGLAVLYRLGPSREKARWRWVSLGAVIATVLWIIASALFSIYVSQFANYNKTYGSLGAVIILLMWLYITAYAILLGGEINAETEHQTAEDSTEGPPEPMGERGATMADTIGRSTS